MRVAHICSILEYKREQEALREAKGKETDL